jgi:biotin-[acetyl-CoA-carboxylase] ligase BirA-like protein
MFAQGDSVQLNALAQHIAASAGLPVQLVDSIESTNQQLMADAAQLPIHPAAPSALMALQQTGGRGRRGRAWQVEQTLSAESVQPAFLASVGVRCSLALSALAMLPLHIGVAVAQQLQAWGCPAQLKWPNDLVINTAQGSAKLGGILVETRSMGAAGEVAVIMGLGLNWHSAPLLDDKLTASVADWAPLAPDAVHVSAGLLAAIHRAWLRCAEQGACDFSAHDALYGKTVQSVSASGDSAQNIQGIAMGINPQGHLGVQTAQGLVWLHSGEVSVQIQP